MPRYPLILLCLLPISAHSLLTRASSFGRGRTHAKHVTGAILPPTGSNTSSQSCGADAFGEAVKSFVVKYRFLSGILWVSVYNCLWQVVSTAIENHEFANVYDKDVLVAVKLSVTKATLVPLLLSGYPLLLHYWWTGCNLFPAYIFIAVFGAAMWEVWEWVRMWPLTPALFFHHSAVILLGLCVLELGLLPTGGPRAAWLVLLNSNVALTWVTDLFHFVFRFARTLRFIERFRYFHLALCPLRLANLGLLSLMCAKLLVGGHTVAGAILAFIAVGFGVQNIKAIRWVWGFQPAAYFEGHQRDWLTTHGPSKEGLRAGPEKLSPCPSVQ